MPTRNAPPLNLSPNVRRGAALLDELDPKWPKRITKETLRMSDPNQCLLGQAHREYSEGLQTLATLAIDKALKGTNLAKVRGLSGGTLAEEIVEDRTYEIDAEYYGFTLPDNDRDENEEWEKLGAAWKRQVDVRLKAGEIRSVPAKKSRVAKKS